MKDSDHSNHQKFYRSLCVDQGKVGLVNRNQNITASNSCEEPGDEKQDKDNVQESGDYSKILNRDIEILC